MKIKRNSKGFTLVEIIIYTAILSVVFVAVFNSVLALMRSFSVGRLATRINTSAEISIERMTREIRLAYDFDNSVSVFNSNPGRLKLETFNSSGATTTIEFYLTGGILMVSEGGAVAESLTSSKLSVSNLIFRTAHDPLAVSEAIKVEMEIEGSYGNYARRKKFYNSAILRGSY